MLLVSVFYTFCGYKVITVPVCLFLFSSLVCWQLLKAWGDHVTVTCSQNAEGLVRGLGADEVVDYTAGDMAEQLKIMERYVLLLLEVCATRGNQAVKSYSTLCLKCQC